MNLKLLLPLAFTAALAFAGSLLAQQGPAVTPPAADKPAADPAAEAAPKKRPAPKSLPFRGTVESVDAKAMTVTLAGREKQRVFNVTSKTRLEKDGKPATFADIKPGDAARGSFERGPEGDNLLKATFGPAPGSAPKKEKAEGEAKPKKKPANKDAAAQ
jgi:hypothetical protein